MVKCPKCKSESRHRMQRKGIYRIIPSTKAYTCDKCNAYYVWFPFFRKAIRTNR